ncbi:nucleoside recognition protein [Desulfococcaceae bacterium HSG7]|nr:nucleoside recognition protein [Desulfococcaceae bacterium HSG7]
MFFITVGLVAGQMIEAAGWTKKLAVVAAPLFRFGNLGERCSAAFTTAFFSGVAANAMLVEFYNEGKISRKQLFLSNFVNQAPAFFLHLPTTFFIVIPLTRWAGALYFLLTFAAMVFRTALFLIYGHFQKDMPTTTARNRVFQKNPISNMSATKNPISDMRKTGVWASVRKKLPGRITGIAIYVLPIYVTVYVINALGWFEITRKWLAEYVTGVFIPMESLSFVILSFAAEFTSGFAAAGALMDAGALTVKQTVLALLIGNIVAFPVRAVRHQLPRYMGIFAPKTGIQLLLMGQGFRVLSLVLAGVVYYFI